MDYLSFSDVIEAMFSAGRLSTVLPRLPQNVERGQAEILFTVYKLLQKQDKVKVTDVSNYKRVTSPGTIRLIQSCERSGLIKKTPDEKDRRVANLELTESGLAALQSFFGTYDQMVADLVAEKYSNEELLQFIEMVYDLLHCFETVTQRFEKEREPSERKDRKR